MARTRSSSRRRAGLLVAAFVTSLVASACSGGPGPASSGAPEGLTIRAEGVELKPNVLQVDAASAAANLQQVGDDGTLVFKATQAGVVDLKPGSVLVVEGLAARKVTSVTPQGESITVATADAGFTDVITDGKLGWTYAVAFDKLPDAAYAFSTAGTLRRDLLASAGKLDADTLRELAVAGTAMRFVGTVKGFEVELKLTPKPDRMDVELSAKRSNVKIQAAGFITNFVQETQMEFDGGTGTLFETKVNGLKGEATVTWNAFQVNDPSLDSDIVALEIPFSIPVPIMVGPIPVTINVKANIRVVPELTSGNASAGGSWKVSYDTDHGFSTNGGDPTPISQLKQMAADLGSEPTVTAGLGVTGFGTGFEFPRLELQLGHPIDQGLLEQAAGGSELYQKVSSLLRPYVFLTLNTYISGLWTPGTTLSGDIPPCQRSSVTVSAIAGYKLSLLGMAELSDNKLIWEKKFDRFKDDRPCTLTGS